MSQLVTVHTGLASAGSAFLLHVCEDKYQLLSLIFSEGEGGHQATAGGVPGPLVFGVIFQPLTFDYPRDTSGDPCRVDQHPQELGGGPALRTAHPAHSVQDGVHADAVQDQCVHQVGHSGLQSRTWGLGLH